MFPVILNLFQDLSELNYRSRNKLPMTEFVIHCKRTKYKT